MADAIVSAVLDQLGMIVAREVEQEVRLVVGAEQEVEKMRNTFQAIQAVMVDAENRHLKEAAVKLWLGKLKHISYDIDDVLDQWKTAILKSKIKRGQTQSSSSALFLPSKVRSCIPSPCSCFGGVALRHDIARKIKVLNEKLQAIAREKDAFSFATASTSSTDPKLERPKTTSSIDESIVCGRDHDKDELIRLLLGDNIGGGGIGKGFPIIAIVGMGGMGKTTLGQLAYNNDVVKASFPQRIWVCVSDPFDEVRIAKAILEALKGTPSNFNELESLHQEISQKINGRKFLLVLDDVWTEDEKKWEPLKLSLGDGSLESKILVTTRSEKVANILGCLRPFPLGVLSRKDSWSLFRKTAFLGRSNENRENLEGIGRELVEKCAGLPLAIKTLASLLRFKETEEQWQRILISEMWNLEGVEKDLYGPLLLSYYDLPVVEKQCFRYCAIFPKDRELERGELIKLWMAQGYLGENREVNDMEILGEERFHNLAIRGFFQEFQRDSTDGSIRSCKMHDIVHDFAQFLTKTECVLAESDGIEVDRRVQSHENVRHLTLINPPCGLVPIQHPLKKLRSFHILFGRNVTDKSLAKLFHRLISLRMLYIGCKCHIPKGIGKLIHLRYVSLEGNYSLCELPETLCDLCNLQTLNIRSCINLQKLPRGMEKLIKLRHLQNADTWRIKFMPKGMERLTCLQTLEEFRVCKGGGSLCLADLGNLIHLRGTLKITGLGNVGEASEAKEARLSTKAGLRRLTLDFDEGYDKDQQTRMEDDASILQALKPPQGLQFLEIKWCESHAFPNWMTSLTSLKTVKLLKCSNWESLPPMGNLPSLESLEIKRMKKVKKVGEEFLGVETSSSSASVNHNIAFPNLKELEFHDMKGWEEWEYEKASSSNITIMPKLQCLSIRECPVLKSLPRHLVQSRTLQEPMIIRSPAFPNWMTSFMSLKSVLLWDCHNLESLPPMGSLPSLESLEIGNMEKVKKVGDEFLGVETSSSSASVNHNIAFFPNLKTLTFYRMKEWEEWEYEKASSSNIAIMPKLQCLSIYDCPVLKSLPRHVLQSGTLQEPMIIRSPPFPNWMTSLTSLKSVVLSGCYNWESLPPMGNLPSLESLEIWDMEKVKKVGEEFLGVETSSSSASVNHNIAFPNLKMLKFEYMKGWEEWENEKASSSNITIMPKLQCLIIWNCPVLKSLPRHLLQSRALQELKIVRSPKLYRSFNRETGDEWPSISHIPTVIVEE